MPFLEFKEYEIVPSPEALLLKPVSVIWKRDRSSGKAKALRELGYVYFMYDPRSDYRISILNEEEREERVRRDMGIDSSWRPDADMKSLIEFYIHQPFIESDDMKALDTSMTSLNKIQDLCSTIELNEEEDPLKAAKTLAEVTKLIPGLLSNIREARKIIHEGMKDTGRVRGSTEKKIGEDGFDKFIQQ